MVALPFRGDAEMEPEQTMLEISRDVLRDALTDAAVYIAMLERGHLTAGERRRCIFIRGLFDELVEDLDAQEAAENECA